MTKSLLLAGSTGSIGTQALKVCEKHNIKVNALSAGSNYKLLAKQAEKFGVKNLCLANDKYYNDLKALVASDVKIYCKEDGLLEMLSLDESDTFFNSVMGSAGLKPTLSAIDLKKKIALANKETIVCGGEIVMQRAKENNVPIYPVDSEHSAIFQCLRAGEDKEVKKIILTASGGPFRGRKNLYNISIDEALNHPNWSMGKKITIDSATMMNKGLEVIEAYHLFNHKPIEVVVHPESIIHSMVEYNDNAVIAQLGTPDMKLPIRYAMTYPNRAVSPAEPLDLLKCPPLTFAEPDEEVFRCLKIAKQCAAVGNVYCAAMNGANEEAVAAFLCDEIGICAIPDLIEAALDKTETVYQPQLSDILEADRLAREVVREKLN